MLPGDESITTSCEVSFTVLIVMAEECGAKSIPSQAVWYLSNTFAQNVKKAHTLTSTGSKSKSSIFLIETSKLRKNMQMKWLSWQKRFLQSFETIPMRILNSCQIVKQKLRQQ